MPLFPFHNNCWSAVTVVCERDFTVLKPQERQMINISDDLWSSSSILVNQPSLKRECMVSQPEDCIVLCAVYSLHLCNTSAICATQSRHISFYGFLVLHFPCWLIFSLLSISAILIISAECCLSKYILAFSLYRCLALDQRLIGN